ncbi:MAG: DUF5698 domain-containing protein [Planctomycetota bacterium]
MNAILAIDPQWLPVFIFVARITDVSLGTVRLICVTRGQRLVAVVLGFFEVLIWVTAVSSVLSHLDRWINILSYAAGFAAGSALGMRIEQSLALGVQMVTLLSRGEAHAVAARLRYAEMVVTTFEGSGREGPVAICFVVVPRRQTPLVIRMAREVDPNVVVTVEDVRDTTAKQPGLQSAKLPTALLKWPGLRR